MDTNLTGILLIESCTFGTEGERTSTSDRDVTSEPTDITRNANHVCRRGVTQTKGTCTSPRTRKGILTCTKSIGQAQGTIKLNLRSASPCSIIEITRHSVVGRDYNRRICICVLSEGQAVIRATCDFHRAGTRHIARAEDGVKVAHGDRCTFSDDRTTGVGVVGRKRECTGCKTNFTRAGNNAGKRCAIITRNAVVNRASLNRRRAGISTCVRICGNAQK